MSCRHNRLHIRLRRGFYSRLQCYSNRTPERLLAWRSGGVVNLLLLATVQRAVQSGVFQVAHTALDCSPRALLRQGVHAQSQPRSVRGGGPTPMMGAASCNISTASQYTCRAWLLVQGQHFKDRTRQESHDLRFSATLVQSTHFSQHCTALHLSHLLSPCVRRQTNNSSNRFGR